MMPIGTSRCGLRASSAWVDTESKPMYAKKIMAAPASTPTGSPAEFCLPSTGMPKKLTPVQS